MENRIYDKSWFFSDPAGKLSGWYIMTVQETINGLGGLNIVVKAIQWSVELNQGIRK
jgi:hypothetical protein